MGKYVSIGTISGSDVAEDPSMRLMLAGRVLRIADKIPGTRVDVPFVVIEYEYARPSASRNKAYERRTARLMIPTDTAIELGLSLVAVADAIGVTPADVGPPMKQ